jgi:hypothetical protein
MLLESRIFDVKNLERYQQAVMVLECMGLQQPRQDIQSTDQEDHPDSGLEGAAAVFGDRGMSQGGDEGQDEAGDQPVA